MKRTELHKFAVMPLRWKVERTIARVNNFRGLSKHYDYDLATGEARILLASLFVETFNACPVGERRRKTLFA